MYIYLSVSNVLLVTSDPLLWVIFTSLCSLFHNYTCYLVVVLILTYLYLLPIIFCVVYLFYDKRPFAHEYELIFSDSAPTDLIKKTWQMTEID